jgi:hypothetical protein
MSTVQTTAATWRTLKTAETVLGMVGVEGYSADEAVEEVREDAARDQATAYNALSPQGKADAVARSTAATELGLSIARSLLDSGADALAVISTARAVAEQTLTETASAPLA